MLIKILYSTLLLQKMALKAVDFEVFKCDGLRIYLNGAFFCISMGN
jgi:hypothetical protein